MMTMATATRRSTAAEPPEAEPTAEDTLLAALARTARQPLALGDQLVVQALAEILWRRGPRR
jgi:hypothetical protein